MEDRELAVNFLHSLSKEMNMRQIKIFGITMTLGIPKHELHSFLDNPKGINQDDVIKVAKMACKVAKILSQDVCPFIGE